MNFPDEPIEHLIARLGPKRAGRYAALRPHAEFIGELRSNRASYDTIVAILRERHSVEVSDTTVRHFAAMYCSNRPANARVKSPPPNPFPFGRRQPKGWAANRRRGIRR